MHSHTVLLPAVALVHPAGVSLRGLISQWGPGEAAQVGIDQAHVAPPAVLYIYINDLIWDSGAHQATVLSVLTIWAWDLVSGRKFTVHSHVPLQICQTGEHLRPARREEERRHRAHVGLGLLCDLGAPQKETGCGEQVQLHGDEHRPISKRGARFDLREFTTGQHHQVTKH